MQSCRQSVCGWAWQVGAAASSPRWWEVAEATCREEAIVDAASNAYVVWRGGRGGSWERGDVVAIALPTLMAVPGKAYVLLHRHHHPA